MSDQTLELVKRIFRNWERGGFSSVEWADPDIAFDVPGTDPEVHGIDEMRRSWFGFLESYEDLRIEARRLYPAGDTVVVEQAFYGKGRASEIPIDQIMGGAVLTIRGGRVIRFRGYTHLGDALAEAGIEPDA